LSEKIKNGGYRCITLRAYDDKGGDFVEQQDLTMVIASAEQQPLVELGSEIPLMSSPEGLYKLIEIGVNNYDPHMFLHQRFTIYFFKREFALKTEQLGEGMP
jgi:hypothetical protein